MKVIAYRCPGPRCGALLAQSLLGRGTTPSRCTECGDTFPGEEWLVGGWTEGAKTTEPELLGGQIVGDTEADPNESGTQIVDTRKALLLEEWVVALTDQEDGSHMVAMSCGGRINQTDRRARVLVLIDVCGAALFAAELVGLAMRMPPEARDEFGAALNERLDFMKNIARGEQE